VAVEIRLIEPEELKKVVVDNTVMPNAIAHPSAHKLLETRRGKLLEAVRVNGIVLKRTFERKRKHLTRKASRYGYTKWYRRMEKVIEVQGTIADSLSREIARKANVLSEAVQEALMQSLGRSNRIRLQAKQSKDAKRPKVYDWYFPKVLCIAKGKVKKSPMSLVPRWELP
jgi:IS5 family transposase